MSTIQVNQKDIISPLKTKTDMSKLLEQKVNSQEKYNHLRLNDFEFRNGRLIYKSSPKKSQLLQRPTSSRINISKQAQSFLIRHDQTLTLTNQQNKQILNKSKAITINADSRSSIKRPFSASTQSTSVNPKENRFVLPQRSTKQSVQHTQSDMKQYAREALESEIKSRMEIITSLNKKEEELRCKIESELRDKNEVKERRLRELKQEEIKILVHPVKQENEIIESNSKIDLEALKDMVQVTNQRLVQLEQLLMNQEKNQSLMMILESQKRKQSDHHANDISRLISQDMLGTTFENQSLFRLDMESSRHKRATSQQHLKIENLSQIISEDQQQNEWQWAAVIIQKNVRMHLTIKSVKRKKQRSELIRAKFIKFILEYLKKFEYNHKLELAQNYKYNKAALKIQTHFRRMLAQNVVRELRKQSKSIKPEQPNTYQAFHTNITSLEQIQEQMLQEQNPTQEQEYGGFMDQNQFRARQDTQFSLVEIIAAQAKSNEMVQFNEYCLREAATIDLPGVMQVETRKNLDSARHLLNAMSLDPEKVELVYSSDGSLRQLSRDLMNDSVIEAQSFQQSKRNIVLSHFLTYRSIPDEINIKQTPNHQDQEILNEIIEQLPHQQTQRQLQFRDKTYTVDIKYYQTQNLIFISERSNNFKSRKIRVQSLIENLEQFVSEDLFMSLLTQQVSNQKLQVVLSVFYVPEVKRIVRNLERIHQSKRYLLSYTLKFKKLGLFAEMMLGSYNKNACLKIITHDDDFNVLYKRFYSFFGVSYSQIKKDFDQSKIAKLLKYQHPAITLKEDDLDIYRQDFLLETFKEVSINVPYERSQLSHVKCEINLTKKIIIITSKEYVIHKIFPLNYLDMKRAKEQLRGIIDRSILLKKHYETLIQTYEVSQICKLNFIIIKLREIKNIKALNIIHQGRVVGSLKLLRQLHYLLIQAESDGIITGSLRIKGRERKKFFINNFVNLSPLITEISDNRLRLNQEEILAI